MALILYKPSVIFVHIPKTAGTSITSGLERAFYQFGPLKRRLFIAQQKILHNRPPIDGVEVLHKHAKANEIRGYIGNQLWNNSETVASVRNPWDLMVSSYHWWLQKASAWKKYHKEIEQIKKLGSFEEFIKSEYGRERINEQRGNYASWLCSESGELLVKNILKFESLDDDWNSYCYKVGLPNVTLPHANRSKHDSYRLYYNQQTREIIANRFSWSIERFGYEF